VKELRAKLPKWGSVGDTHKLLFSPLRVFKTTTETLNCACPQGPPLSATRLKAVLQRWSTGFSRFCLAYFTHGSQ